MMQKGYGRLLAALVAAAGVHAMLFIGGATPLATQNGSYPNLQVDLVMAEQSPPALPETMQAADTKMAKKHASALPQHPTHMENSQKVRQIAEAAKPMPQVTYHPYGEVGKQAGSAAADSEPQPVPVGIQAEILAQVHYPRLARKRGWEGEVHLQFNVSNRAVADIAMLKGSAHPALDEAARAGLLRMRTVALADGRYWMPVVFQLR